MLITKSLKESVVDMYLDYCNNYLTVEKFASDYNITETKALRVLGLGKRIMNR